VKRSLAVVLAVLLAVVGGMRCRRHGAAPATPPLVATAPEAAGPEATAPEAPGFTFDRPDLGVRLDVPAGWVQHRSDDFVLLVAPAAAGGDASAPSISLDVPDLPPHIPGMIPVGSVRGGYLDDLRKSAGNIKTADLTPPPIPSSARRFVRSTWTDAQGRPTQETALLLVHADRVYILRGRSTLSDEPATRPAFDDVVRSLQWRQKK
jgi:hypothetical protein